MSKTILEPANIHVLAVDLPRTTSIDGIEMPDNERQQDMVFGVVVAAGPLATETKAEDRICYGPYAGKNVILDGVVFRLLLQGQIEGYLRQRD